MNKAQLIETLAKRANLARADAARAVDVLFGTRGIVIQELKAGRKVQVTGFGTFHARPRAARAGRNPRTGQAITIPAVAVPSFKAGQQLRAALARPR